LLVNDEYFEELIQLGLYFDSSITNDYNNNPNQMSYWPFTLDYGFPGPNDFLYANFTPTMSHPGLWEFLIPLNHYPGGSTMLAQDYTDTDAVLTELQNDFMFSYNANKVPRGEYLHYVYFLDNTLQGLDPVKVQFVTNYYEWLSTNYGNNILFATEKMVLDWMKNPQSLEITKTLPEFQCANNVLTPSTICAWTVCTYPSGYTLKTCSIICPLILQEIGKALSFLMLCPIQVQSSLIGLTAPNSLSPRIGGLGCVLR